MLGRVEAGDDVVGHVVPGHLADRRHRHAFMDERAGRAACRPRRCSCGVALRMRIFASSWACTDSTISTPTSLPGRPAGDEAVLDDPLDEALGHHRRRVVDSRWPRFTRSATSGGGRGVMRSTIAHGQVVCVSTQARSAARRGARGSRAGRRESASPLLRRLSQFSSVTAPPPRRMRAPQDRRDGAVDRRARLGPSRSALQRRRCARSRRFVGIEVVAGLGDGERDDARSTARRRRSISRARRRLERNHLADRA